LEYNEGGEVQVDSGLTVDGYHAFGLLSLLKGLGFGNEMASFPNVWRMRWLPLEQIIGGEDLEILQTFADNPQFAASRDDHYQFGLDNFMGLERLKENFPPLHGDEWMVEDANAFAWGTAMDYLGRHFPRFLRAHWDYICDREFDSLDSLLSLRARSLFVFFKYYLHRQAPGKSDFFDFLHVSYAPYCDVFVTERNVCNVLRRIKNEELMLAQTEILHISDLISEMRRASGAL
jgi:hypothetical protein